MTLEFTTTHLGIDTPSIKRQLDFPADWQNYSLTKMFDEMERQAVATFANARQQVQPLLDLDSSLLEQLPTIFHQPASHEVIPSMLFMRMFSCQRAAARLVFSGQQYEARAVLRCMLECGVYAWALMSDVGLRSVWANRDNDDVTRKTARAAFAWNGLTKTLRSVEPDLEVEVCGIYDGLIDLGAHPNPGGIVEGITLVKVSKGNYRLLTDFGGVDSATIDAYIAELMAVCKAGYSLLKLAMPERIGKNSISEPVEKILGL